MGTTAGQFAEAVAEEIPNFFRDTFDQFADGEGEYLRSGNPRSGTSKVGQAVGRAYCRLYGQNPDSVLGGIGPRVEKACRPYLDDLGFPQGPKAKVAFPGGQCALSYAPFGTYTATCGSSAGQTFDWSCAGIGTGPVTGIAVIDTGFYVTFANSGPISANGQPTGTILIDAGPGRPTQCGQLPSELQGAKDVVITNVNPIGHSDNCGSAPPTITPPPPITNPQPPPFRFNPDGDIDVNIDVDINPDGSVTFDVGTGPITVDPFGGDDGGGGGGPPTPPPGDVGDPGSSEDTGMGGEAEGEAPPGSVLVGLRLGLLATPPNAREFAPGVFRGACYVYMGTPSGLDHDPAGAMLQDGQFVFAERENLTNWKVRANVGYNIRTTPYYREQES